MLQGPIYVMIVSDYLRDQYQAYFGLIYLQGFFRFRIVNEN